MNLVTVANMVSTIKNGLLVGAKQVFVRKSRLTLGILKALKLDGYIEGYSENSEKPYYATALLKYDAKGLPVIRDIWVVSKGSRTVNVGAKEFKTREQYSTLIVSTSKLGVVSHIDARRENTGGIVLCEVTS